MLADIYKAIMPFERQCAANDKTESRNICIYRVNLSDIVNHCENPFAYRSEERLIFYRQFA